MRAAAIAPLARRSRWSRRRSSSSPLFFVFPLVLSARRRVPRDRRRLHARAFREGARVSTRRDLIFTVAIVALSTLLIALVAIAIAGYLTLGENPRAVAILRWLYRWPLFIPFVVAGQMMRTFLAKNGMLNHVLIGTGLIEPLPAQSVLDWRGIVIAFVWKQAPFVTLLARRRDGVARARSTSRRRAISARRAGAC